MATLESDDRNIVEGDEVNWRLIVYPLVLAIVVLLGGFGIYYYQLNEREIAETQAREALVQAKSPEDMVKVADQYPGTTQAAVALIGAADASYAAKNYDAAVKAYQRIISSDKIPSDLLDSAQYGLGSTQEASGKSDDAIQSYLVVAHKGSQSPFAPAAYHAVAQIYADRKDTANEQKVLQQTLQLGGESPFVKEAAAKLKEISTAGAVSAIISAATNAPSATNAAP